MYPNVYVTEGFLENFDKCYNELPAVSIYDMDTVNKEKRESVDRIRNLFLISNIYTDAKSKTLVKCCQKQFGTFNNIKDLVFHTLIKNSNQNRPILYPEKQASDCQQSNFCYFMIDHAEVNNGAQIILGNDFLDSPFYLYHTFAGELTNAQIHQVDRIKHPCKSLVIIDGYIFQDDERYEPKIPNLIHFLTQLIPDGLSQKFEIDIITSNRNEINFQNKFNQIVNAFPNRISLHIYTPRNLSENDRYLLTNYATVTVGHPFDRNTNISCSFYPSGTSSNDVNEAFKTWSRILKRAEELKKNTPPRFGLVQAIWRSDDLQHSIFNCV
jgi:hypothetical protein